MAFPFHVFMQAMESPQKRQQAENNSNSAPVADLLQKSINLGIKLSQQEKHQLVKVEEKILEAKNNHAKVIFFEGLSDNVLKLLYKTHTIKSWEHGCNSMYKLNLP